MNGVDSAVRSARPTDQSTDQCSSREAERPTIQQRPWTYREYSKEAARHS